MRKASFVGRGAQPIGVPGPSLGGAAAASSTSFSLYSQTSASNRSRTPSRGVAAKQMRTGGRGYSTADVTTDPRPNTKAFKDQSIRKLADFLVANNYQHHVTLKQLNQPSKSDFRKIFEFLINFLKPGFTFGENMEEEIPTVLKLYGYPFAVPKSHFQTIGVPHISPIVLNILTWLRVNIQASIPGDFHSVLLAPTEDDHGIVGQRKMLWDYTNEAYDLYMAGAEEIDSAVENLEKRLATNSRIDEEINSLANEIKRNKKILDELMAQSNELSTLQSNLDCIKIESEKFERYHVTMEAHLKNLMTRLSRVNEDDAEQSVKLEALESEKQARLRVLADQKNEGMNFPHLITNLGKLQRRLQVIENENQDIATEIRQNEQELKQDKEQMETLVKEYNRMRRAVIPERDDLNIKPEITVGDRVFIQEIQHQLRLLRGKLNERLEKLEEELLKAKSDEENWEEVVQEHEKEKTSLVGTAAQVEEQIREKKEGHQRKMDCLLGQISEWKGRCDLKSSDVTEAKNLCASAETNLKAMKAKFEAEEERLATFVEEVMQFCLEHKKKMQAHIRALVEDGKKLLLKLDD